MGGNSDSGVAERGFRMLVELSADGVVVTDATTHRLRYVSRGAGQLLGVPAGDLLGRSAGERVHPDDVAGWMAPAPGETVVTTSRYRHRDGSWRWIEATTTNLCDDPALGGYVSYFRDVTERKQAEDAMREAQRRLQYVLSATAAVTYAARAHGDFGATFMSANVKEVTGHDASAFLDVPNFWIEHIHPEDRAAVDAGLQTLLESGEHTFQYRFRRADGRFHWVHDAARVVRDDDGRPREIIGYWIDVDERTHAENALRGSEANFRTLIERSPTAILVHRGGQIVYVNPAAVAMLAYDRASDLVGAKMLELLHPEDREFIRERMARCAREGAVEPAESRMLRRDGRIVTVEAEGLRLDFDGEASNVVLARDVTERREMFARIAVADRMVSVGTLAAGVAHELNNPLSYLMSNLALLARDLPALLGSGEARSRVTSSDIERILEDAQEGATRVRTIVRDLRKLSRGDDDAQGPVDVLAALRSSLKMAHNEIRHRARIRPQLDEPLPLVYGNASRLGQVFLNLLLNAAQAIPDGRVDANEIRIRAGVSGDGRTVVIEVQDTGAGIPPSILGRIFDPFFTTKPIGVGTGLGLSICHQIVRSIGGDISVTSTPGEGSCFRVALPAISGEEAHPDSAVEPGGALPRVARVLMVDDEPALGRSTRLLLSPEYDVVNVTRAREALELLESGERFDVILCDLMMPEMSGMELHEEIRRVAPEYVGRIAFITGGAFTEDARAFLAASATVHIEKPFTETALRRAIETMAVGGSGGIRTPSA